MEEMGGYLVAHAVAGGTTTYQSPLLSLGARPHWRRAPPPGVGTKLGRRDP